MTTLAIPALLGAHVIGPYEGQPKPPLEVVVVTSKALLQDFNENFEILLENPDFVNVSQKIFNWYIQHDTKNAAKLLSETAVKKIRRKMIKKPGN